MLQTNTYKRCKACSMIDKPILRTVDYKPGVKINFEECPMCGHFEQASILTFTQGEMITYQMKKEEN